MYKGIAVATPTRAKGNKATMIFNFEKFSDIVTGVYQGGPYTLDDVLFVFRHYFDAYERNVGKPHPNIRAEQIASIIDRMPYVDGRSAGGSICDILPEDYPAMIERHFNTRYQDCDYNINHFFSGRIRFLRLYEILR